MIGTHGGGERMRLRETERSDWRRWGPYVSDRQWGTVREDYSATGEAWEYLPFDAAQRRAYRSGEDGIFGISDDHQYLCFALALWNGNDDRLKERLFGLTGNQGNHGEDVKEYYFHIDNVPSHAYMHALYKYPQAAFPYDRLLDENRRRTRLDPEYELIDTGVFDQDRYFDVEVRYAKASPNDTCIEIRATNRASEARELHLLPTLWFRNRPFADRCCGMREPARAMPRAARAIRASAAIGSIAKDGRNCSSPTTRPTIARCGDRATNRPTRKPASSARS